MDSFDDLIKSSVSYFVAEYPESCMSSRLLSVFSKLVVDLKNPPVEIVWFYATLKFHTCKQDLLLPPEKFLVVKKLLRFFTLCSHSCTLAKKVAILSPVLYFLYHLSLNFSANDPNLREEIRILVDQIVCYVSICCSKYLEEGGSRSDNSGVNVLGLARVWTIGQISPSCDADVLAEFFPLSNKGFRQEVNVCLDDVAGVVMCEALFLRLYVNISPRLNKEDLQKYMLNLAIQTIKGSHSFYFSEILLKTLLEPSLPIATLLSYDEKVAVRIALYDAIMVEYSFHSGRCIQSTDSQTKRLALLWVLVADRAIQFARDKADQARAISYLKAFHESEFVSSLISWASSQGGTLIQMLKPDVSSPKAFIRWLLVLENQGLSVFDHGASMCCLRALMLESMETGSPQCKLDFKNLNPDIFICNEAYGKRDQEMSELSKIGFSGKKRKDGLRDWQESRMKHPKIDYFRSPARSKFLPLSNGNGMHCGVKVNSASSSEDEMEP